MCNARNHPEGCTCGFGGFGHAGKRGAGINSYQIPYYFDLNYERSYVNKNAKCPICGQPVYFYKSENGGRVFFDELGPPWPKHPCTDIKYNDLQYLMPNQNFELTGSIRGLFPVIIFQNISKSRYCYIISRLKNYYGKKNLELMLYDSDYENLLLRDAIHFAERINEKTINISSYNFISGKEIKLRANFSSSILDAFF